MRARDNSSSHAMTGVLKPIEALLTQITVNWFGSSHIVSVLLLFGAVRIELVVFIPTILFGTTNLATVFNPAQMIVLAFVTMIYVPCVATFAVLEREFV